MKNTLIALSLILLSGCIKPIAYYDALRNGNEECIALNGIGDVNNLFQQLKIETSAVRSILDNVNVYTETDLNNIHSHALEIENIGNRINQISTNSWSKENSTYDAQWIIKPRDVKFVLGPYLPHDFIFQNAVIEKVFYMGEEREDLREKMEIYLNQDFDHNSVLVKFKTKSSLLFNCQLKHTLLTTIKITGSDSNSTQTFSVNLLIE